MFTVFKKLSWYFKEQWVRYTLAITALSLVNVIGLFPPILVGNIIDLIQYNQLTYERMMDYILIFVLILVSHYSLGIYWDYTLFGRAILLEKKMRSKLMNHFMRMSASFFGRYRTGDLM